MDSHAHKFQLLEEEPRDTQPAPPTNPTPYEVQHGYQLHRCESFATFGEALAFYKGFVAGSPYRYNELRVLNRNRYDGDNNHGLTEAERDELEAL